MSDTDALTDALRQQINDVLAATGVAPETPDAGMPLAVAAQVAAALVLLSRTRMASGAAAWQDARRLGFGPTVTGVALTANLALRHQAAIQQAVASSDDEAGADALRDMCSALLATMTGAAAVLAIVDAMDTIIYALAAKLRQDGER